MNFHTQRVMFYLDFTGQIQRAPEGDSRSHAEWFQAIGVDIETVVRGYYKDGLLRLYQGDDFRVPVCPLLWVLSTMMHFGVTTCGLGLVVGEIGAHWEPRYIVVEGLPQSWLITGM